ncbi:hypothetical protein BU26DRAFT_563823 [Trematosphaeria pertusa]|uniref:Secreted protein n=1 Tax=Trematosphaeria pertusa TaxID=390896 RepID=A0A6A6IKB8_9PLEO|nr:uncharacterized protein BU26DRAFT_563823 [Trematosphaeria pertusa]KAF2249933.1 hypothetical protein BU26DRAFT_563823 [Trematosphaeria pertusa]
MKAFLSVFAGLVATITALPGMSPVSGLEKRDCVIPSGSNATSTIPSSFARAGAELCSTAMMNMMSRGPIAKRIMEALGAFESSSLRLSTSAGWYG